MGRVVGKVYPMNGIRTEATSSQSGKPHTAPAPHMNAGGEHAKKEGGKRVAGKAQTKA